MQISYHELAKQDVRLAANYLASRNVDAALRFLRQIDVTADQLVVFPLAGTLEEALQDIAPGLRRTVVSAFETYTLYYVPREDEIEVVRVLHHALDRDAILRDEP